ncbi:MAG: cyclophilin-like family protein [Candidatus Hodarchaeales archaeon]
MIDSVTVKLLGLNGEELVMTLNRELGPRTVALIERTILNSTKMARIVKKKDEYAILLKIGRVGPEQSKKEVNAGDVAYWPQGNMLMLYKVPKKLLYPVNVIGTAKKLAVFESIKSGSMVRLFLVSEEESSHRMYLD